MQKRRRILALSHGIYMCLVKFAWKKKKCLVKYKTPSMQLQTDTTEKEMITDKQKESQSQDLV
jgi:hypothetical protein